MRDILVPMPPLPEQDFRVAAFLKRETAKIDALWPTKRLIDLLKEKRQAVISYAVTKGLNLRALKPSGVEWLGHVPEHWILPFPVQRPWIGLRDPIGHP